MAISINPVLPVLAAQEVGGVAPELVLQPGSVVNAQVLKVLSADLVRIAIASLSIDVARGGMQTPRTRSSAEQFSASPPNTRTPNSCSVTRWRAPRLPAPDRARADRSIF